MLPLPHSLASRVITKQPPLVFQCGTLLCLQQTGGERERGRVSSPVNWGYNLCTWLLPAPLPLTWRLSEQHEGSGRPRLWFLVLSPAAHTRPSQSCRRHWPCIGGPRGPRGLCRMEVVTWGQDSPGVPAMELPKRKRVRNSSYRICRGREGSWDLGAGLRDGEARGFCRYRKLRHMLDRSGQRPVPGTGM